MPKKEAPSWASGGSLGRLGYLNLLSTFQLNSLRCQDAVDKTRKQRRRSGKNDCVVLTLALRLMTPLSLPRAKFFGQKSQKGIYNRCRIMIQCLHSKKDALDE